MGDKTVAIILSTTACADELVEQNSRKGSRVYWLSNGAKASKQEVELKVCSIDTSRVLDMLIQFVPAAVRYILCIDIRSA